MGNFRFRFSVLSLPLRGAFGTINPNLSRKVQSLQKETKYGLIKQKGVRAVIRIAIVEDEKDYAMQLQGYIRDFQREYGESFEITLFTDGDEIVYKYRSQFDIILMDVQMKYMDGMTAAEEIRKMDSDVVIIFITNMSQYAIRGYAVDALDYILKPVSYFAFSQRLRRAISRMKNRTTKSIVANVRDGIIRLQVNQICYIESQGHNVVFHTVTGDYEVLDTIKELEQTLSEVNFFRGNKWYLVNLAYVVGTQDGFIKLDNAMLPLSRSRKKDFMAALTRYWGDVMK